MLGVKSLQRLSKSTSRLGHHRNSGSICELRAEKDTTSGFDSYPGIPTPRQLRNYLDGYIVGQTKAKKALSVAVYNHYIRMRHLRSEAVENMHPLSLTPARRGHQHLLSEDLEKSFPDHTDIARRHPYATSAFPHAFADRHIPRIDKSNVLVIGPTGTGKTLLARTLARVLDVPFATSDATALTQAGYVGEDVEMCLQRLLQVCDWDIHRASFGIVYIDEIDKLARRSTGSRSGDGSRDIGGEGVQQALLRMIEGSNVTISAKGGNNSVSSPGPNNDTMPMAPGLSPHKRGNQESYTLDTTNILFIFSGAFVGLEDIVRRRTRDAERAIGFGSASLASVKEMGSTGYKDTRSWEEDVLPEDLNAYGFIPEFISRLPVLATLTPLSTSSFLQILTDVKDSLVSQYVKLFEYSGMELRFTGGALKEIAEMALKRGGGARGLRSIVESTLLDAMYEGPGSSVRYILVNRDVVRGIQPALYWSRGEGAAFWAACKDEDFTEPGADSILAIPPSSSSRSVTQRPSRDSACFP